jgi:hypothetical protein
MSDLTNINPATNLVFSGFWQRVGKTASDAMALQSFCLLIAVSVLWFSPLTANSATPNEEAVVQKDVNEVDKTKFLHFSEQQYEELLATSSVNFSASPSKPNTVPAKPIALELSSYSEGGSNRPLIEIHVSPEISLGSGGYAIIQIDHVLNDKGEDIYDQSYETEFYQTRLFEVLVNYLSNPVNADREINIKEGTKNTNIKSVSGIVRLFLPVNSRAITFSGADVGKAKNIFPDLQITMNIFGTGEQDNTIGVNVAGEKADLLLKNLYAYNAKRELLRNLSFVSSGVSEKSITWSVDGTPSTAELIVAEKILVKEYPFTLKK